MGVEFEEDKEYTGYNFGNKNLENNNPNEPKGIMGIFISIGIAKNPNQAKIIAIVLTIIFFGISIYLFINS